MLIFRNNATVGAGDTTRQGMLEKRSKETMSKKRILIGLLDRRIARDAWKLAPSSRELNYMMWWKFEYYVFLLLTVMQRACCAVVLSSCRQVVFRRFPFISLLWPSILLMLSVLSSPFFRITDSTPNQHLYSMISCVPLLTAWPLSRFFALPKAMYRENP